MQNRDERSCQIIPVALNRNRSIEFDNDNKEYCRSSSGSSRDEHDDL